MGVLSYILVFIVVFVVVSLIDYVWHLVLLRKQFEEGIKQVGIVKDGKIQMQSPASGLISQVLVISSIMFLVIYSGADSIIEAAAIGGAGGVLAISVYGLVNRAIIKGWGKTITALEVIWGPLIGAMTGALVLYLVNLF